MLFKGRSAKGLVDARCVCRLARLKYIKFFSSSVRVNEGLAMLFKGRGATGLVDARRACQLAATREAK